MTEIADHRDLLASLPQEVRRDLCRQSDGPALLHLGLQLGLILLGAVYIQAGWPGWPILLIPQGILLVFLFTALHECIHKTPFRTPWLNDWAARLCGFLVILGPAHFRYFHLAHHRFTHDPEHDPELASPKPDKPLQYITYFSDHRIGSGAFGRSSAMRSALSAIPMSRPARIQKSNENLSLF